MTTPRQGEIWWAEAEDKRRPVLVVTRSEAVPVLVGVVVAPVTRRVRKRFSRAKGVPSALRRRTLWGLRRTVTSAPAALACWMLAYVE